MTPGGPQGGYKLILIPDEMIYGYTETGQARLIAQFPGRPGGIIGPFEFIGHMDGDGTVTTRKPMFVRIAPPGDE